MVISLPDINSKALEYEGNSFTYECIFEFKINYYSIPFGGWRRELTTSLDEHQTQQVKKKYISTLPKSVSVSSQRILFKDGRTKSNRQQGIAIVTERETLTISVPKQISWDIYFNHYAKSGYPFRDYLLSNRLEKLKQIITRFPLTVHQMHFCIFTTHFSDDPTREVGFHLPFSFIGLDQLAGISQCYGLAIALIEVMGNDRDAFLIIDGGGYIEVKPKPSTQTPLEQW